MSGFDELGLAAGPVAAAETAGYDAPAPLQRAAVPVLRRGGNAALLASSGSGVTAAWALALIDRLYANAEPESGEPAIEPGDLRSIRPRVLVLCMGDERATRVARTIVRLAGDLEVPVRALNVEWSAHGGSGFVTASVGTASRMIGESSLKLDGLDAIVFEQVGHLLAIEGDTALDMLASVLPPDAQRIITVAEWTKPIERFVEAHARRALTIPARSVESVSEPAGRLSYLTVAPGEKADALARILRRERAETPLVSVRSDRRASIFAEELRVRGFRASTKSAGAPDVIIAPVAALPGPGLIAADIPFDADALSMMNLTDGLVLIAPAELPHLRAIAGTAGVELAAVGTRPQRAAAAVYREEVRRAIGERDIDAQIALLGPLFERYSAVEIAAALSALLRDKRQQEPKPTPQATEPGRPQAFVRLFVSAGTRDNIRPGDLVGAITGEAAVTGEQIGKIELRDTFSVVEVAADVANRVIKALNGTTMRGRSLRVDFDRKPSAPAPRASRPFRPQRS